MDKLNENLSWYQAKIGNYDKQYWELSAEQRILQGLERRPKMKAGTSVLQPELIDVDLIRGSAYTKAKPLHNGRVIIWNGFIRVVFAPLYYRFWCQHTSEYFAILFMLHYTLCILHIVVNLKFASRQTFWDEHSMPLLCTVLLGIIHAHIVSPVMQKKKKSPKQDTYMENSNRIMEESAPTAAKTAATQEQPVSIIVNPKKKRHVTRVVTSRRRPQNAGITIGLPPNMEPTSSDFLAPRANTAAGETEIAVSDTGLETETPSEYTCSFQGGPEISLNGKPMPSGLEEGKMPHLAVTTPFINIIAATPVTLVTNGEASTAAGNTADVKPCDPVDLQAFIHAKNKQIPDPVAYPDVPPPPCHCHHAAHHHNGAYSHTQAQPLRASSLSGDNCSFYPRPQGINLGEEAVPLVENADQTLYDPPLPVSPHLHMNNGREREISPFSQEQVIRSRSRHTSFGNASTSMIASKSTRHASLSIEPDIYALSTNHNRQSASSRGESKEGKRLRTCPVVQFTPPNEQIESCSSSPRLVNNQDEEQVSASAFGKPIHSPSMNARGHPHYGCRSHHPNLASKKPVENYPPDPRDGAARRQHYKRHGRYNSFTAQECEDRYLLEKDDEDVFQVANEDILHLEKHHPSELALPSKFDGELQYPTDTNGANHGGTFNGSISNDKSGKGLILNEELKLPLPQSDDEVDEEDENLLSPRSRDSASDHSDSHGNSADDSAGELSDSDSKLMHNESVDFNTNQSSPGVSEDNCNIQHRSPEKAISAIINGCDCVSEDRECKVDLKKEATSNDTTYSSDSISPKVLIEDSTVAQIEYLTDYFPSTTDEDKCISHSVIHQEDLPSSDGKLPPLPHQAITVTTSNNSKCFKLMRSVPNVPECPAAVHTCQKEMLDVEQAFLRDMPELNAISNEDTITTNRRQKTKFETLFRMRSEVTRRCAAAGESILCHKHHPSHSSQGDTEDDMEVGNRNNSIKDIEPLQEKQEAHGSTEDYATLGGVQNGRKSGTKGYASSAGGSSSGVTKSLGAGVGGSAITNTTISTDVTGANKKGNPLVVVAPVKKKPALNKTRISRAGSSEMREDSGGATLKPTKPLLQKAPSSKSNCPCYASDSNRSFHSQSQVSETEYDRINSDVASEDSTSIEDDAASEPPPTLQDPEDPFVLWYKETHQGGTVPKAHPSLTEAVGCFFWENGTLKKADLTLLDIGWSIIQSVEKQPEDPTYMNVAIWFPLLLACLPVLHRFYTNSDQIVQIYSLFLHLQLVFTQKPSALYDQLKYQQWSSMWILLLGVVLRLFCYFLAGVLLFIAEKTFQQRLQYAKHFCYLTSSRLARKYHLPHFRLNKVRNIKFWLSLRSYLKKRGPQRSVESIITYVFYLFFFLISIVCFRILTSDANLLYSLLYWEIGGILVFLSIFIVRFITMSTKITKKYRNLSVLMTEQINLYLTIDKKPHKRDELLLANNTLKLAEDLLKEVDGPFRVCGWSINPLVYNILKVVILSACSAVLSDYCGFKLKLYKIKLNPINW